jgi:hypothetical protein
LVEALSLLSLLTGNRTLQLSFKVISLSWSINTVQNYEVIRIFKAISTPRDGNCLLHGKNKKLSVSENRQLIYFQQFWMESRKIMGYTDDQWEFIWSTMAEDGAWAVPNITDGSGNALVQNFAPELMIKYITHNLR